MGNPEIERELLSVFVQEHEIRQEYFSVLTPEDFSDIRNATLYSIMQRLQREEKPFDPFVIREEIKKNNLLDKVGGIEYIYDYLNPYALSTMAKSYFDTVMDYSRRRRLQNLARELEARCAMEEIPTDQLVNDIGENVTRLVEDNGNAVPDICSFLDAQLMEMEEGGLKDDIIYTGYSGVDKMLGGMKKGTLTVLGARTGVGKTALAINVALNACRNEGRDKKRVLYISLEISEKEILYRAESCLLGINNRKLRDNCLSEGERAAFTLCVAQLREMGLQVKYSSCCSLQSITQLAYAMKRRMGLDFIIVDYLQLMDCPDKKERYNAVGMLSRGLKCLAGTLDIPILTLAQLNRAPDARADKRPVLADLRESGSIEQDADVVILLHRDDYYDKAPEKQGLAEIIIAKNRNGPTGTVHMFFDKGCGRIMEMG